MLYVLKHPALKRHHQPNSPVTETVSAQNGSAKMAAPICHVP